MVLVSLWATFAVGPVEAVTSAPVRQVDALPAPAGVVDAVVDIGLAVGALKAWRTRARDHPSVVVAFSTFATSRGPTERIDDAV